MFSCTCLLPSMWESLVLAMLGNRDSLSRNNPSVSWIWVPTEGESTYWLQKEQITTWIRFLHVKLGTGENMMSNFFFLKMWREYENPSEKSRALFQNVKKYVTTISLALFLWSLSVPNRPPGTFHSYSFTFLKVFIRASPIQSTWTHKTLPMCRARIIFQGLRNIFRSLELLSKLHQCDHRLRKYQFSPGKILILFWRNPIHFYINP